MKPLSLNVKIWLVVILIHLTGILFISRSSVREKSPQKKLIVVTKQFTPKIVAPTLVHKVEKPSPLPPPPKKIVSLKKNPPPKKAKPIQKSPKQVLKKIDQRLTKPHTPEPKLPQPKIVETALSSYIDSACSIFHNALILPEKGQVRLTVTVEPNGKISQMFVEAFESEKNLDYLMGVLPTLLLPPPEKGKEIVFTVLFCND